MNRANTFRLELLRTKVYRPTSRTLQLRPSSNAKISMGDAVPVRPDGMPSRTNGPCQIHRAELA